MQDVYYIQSDRYHRLHKFVRNEHGNYDFVPEQEWMPVYVTMSRDGDCVDFIDTEGGPCISVGWQSDKIIVKDIIYRKGKNPEFVLEERY